MNFVKPYAYLGALMLLSSAPLLQATEHADEAMKHAEQAAHSAGDSSAIQEHATEALKHIEAAKAAGVNDPEKLKHLLHGEKELRHAVEDAKQFNTPSAGSEASEALHHLEKAQSQHPNDPPQ